MKKFLTVLLVIAVMFTFSFGTAMAATDADAFSAAVAAYKSALTYTGDGYLTSAGVPTASDEWKDKVSKTILEAAIDAWADDADLTSSTAYLSGSNLNTTYLYTSAFVTSVEAAQYDAELAKLNDLIASIDLAAYNTTGKTALQSAIETAEDNVAALTGGKTIANAASVKGEVTTLKSAVSTNKANLLSEVSDDLAKTIAALETKLADKSDDYYAFGKALFPANPTNPTVVSFKASFDDDFNALVDYFAACIDRYESEVIAEETPFDTATRIGQVIDYFFAENASVNDPTSASSYFQTAVGNLDQRDVLVAAYEKEAAKAKAAVKADGTKQYYDVDVDNLLADTLDAVENDLWAGMNGSWGTTAATTWDLSTIVANAYNLQGYRTTAKNSITTGAYASTNWSDERKDKVEAIQDEYAEKILLAKTVDEIDDLVEAAQDAMDAILTTAQMGTVAGKAADRAEAAGFFDAGGVTTTVDEVTAAASTTGGFGAYFDVVVGSSTTYKAAIKADALKAAAQVFVDAVIAEEDANITYKKIDEIIAANKDAAYAALKNVKTTEELKAEAAAVAELIKALPTTIKAADKDQVLAAQAAMDAYLENAGAAQGDVAKNATLKNALSTIINAEDREVAKLIRALPAYPTVADAEKVEAARAAYDALVDAYGDYVGTALTTVASLTSEATLLTAESRLETAKLENAAKLIDALTNASSKAEIEAAKAAFDGLETESKLKLNDQLYNKLMAAVETLGMNAEDAKAYVQDLKIAARSVKTSKGVKVTINADVQELLDNGYTVEYKFYRSTKSNKNFGTAKVVKTENTYLNTSGTKGTRYYYKAKLVVKNAAGEVVATTPLTQCLYATRTF